MSDTLQMDMDVFLPLRDVVFKTLREAILTGELKPGERLMEIHLANRLGVSRTPIREAIRKLELEGLVIMIPRKGAQVANITIKGLQDVLEVRKALEELAVKIACKNITEEELTALKKAADVFAISVKNKNVTDIAKADVAFHDIIYHATNNERLIVILHNLREQMYRYRVEYLKEESIYSSLVQEHTEIVRSLEAGGKERAARAIKTHIDNQEKHIINRLQER